jgi:hypothetical protein
MGVDAGRVVLLLGCGGCWSARFTTCPHQPLSTSHPLAASPGAAHYRREALTFLHVCLASVLNLRSPADSALPGTPLDKLTEMLLGDQPPPHVLPTQSRVRGGGAGPAGWRWVRGLLAACRGAGLGTGSVDGSLSSACLLPRLPSPQVDLGVKTKTQLVAERQVGDWTCPAAVAVPLPRPPRPGLRRSSPPACAPRPHRAARAAAARRCWWR